MAVGAASAQESDVTLSGYVTDAQTSETLIGVSIHNTSAGSGTTTNNYGHYALQVPLNQSIRVRFSYVGYEPVDTVLTITKETHLNIAMKAQESLLGEVVVTASRTTELKTMETGRVKIASDDIRKAPSLMGENDLVKYVQLLPGVSKGTEGFSGPVVRGGNVDENLYLLDGNPLYNVSHLMGLFSTFNSDAVKTANFYKGSFPARFGGRLSSVLDVRMKDGDMKKFHGALSIGLISSRLHLEGPIWKDKTSFSVSLRRTYADILLRPFINRINKENSSQNEKNNVYPGYYFYDINAKINHTISDSDRLFLSFYLGQDKLSVRTDNWGRHTYSNSYEPDKINTEEYSEKVKLRVNWGNMLISMGWNHLFSPSLFANTTIYYGKYRSLITTDMARVVTSSLNPTIYHNFNMDINSGIEDVGLRSDFEWRPQNEHYIRFGLDAIMHKFIPTMESMKVHATAGSEFPPFNQSKEKGTPIKSQEVALYAEDEITFLDNLSANIGARGSYLSVEGKSYWSLEPRASIRYSLLPTLSLKASYAEMTQYVHLLQSTAISLPTDLWVPVTSKIKPMRSRQAVLGLYWEKNGYEVSAEGYYKWLHNQIAYKDGAAMYFSEVDWQNRVAIGQGRSYGSELLLRKATGKFTGWISYTLSWSDRIFPGGEVNNGKRFWDKYDNRHKLNIVAQYTFNKRADISAAWVFSSGNRMSLESGFKLDMDGYPELYVSERNNFQLPNYHRLDLGVNFYRYGKNGQQHIWNISVYNAYMQHNSFMVELTEEYSEKEEVRKPVIRSYSLFPIIPSISYTFKFWIWNLSLNLYYIRLHYF